VSPLPAPERAAIGVRIAAVGLVLIVAGCAGTVGDVEEAKELAAAGDFAALAAFEIDCEEQDPGCNQLHLLKGDACFRLARLAAQQEDAAPARREYLDCATRELATGIDMTGEWDPEVLDRAAFQANYCEAARLRADLGERETYEAMLADCADTFAAFAPSDPGAVFFSSRAEYYALTRMSIPCQGLEALEARLDAATDRFSADLRYGDAIAALRATVSAERRARCR
jgi:hypothetical protein